MKKSESGITLVEILAAISVFSMIVLLASSIQLFSQKQMNSQTKEIQIQSDERLASNLITKEIRKAETVEVKKTNELTINGTDVYRLEGTILKKNNENFISNISSFTVSKNQNQVKVKIGNLPETVLYIRE